MVSSKLLAKNFVYLLIGELFSRLLQFLYIRRLSTLIGVESYGQYEWAFSIVVFGFMIVTLGTQVLGVKEYNKTDDKEGLYSIIFTIKLILSILVILSINITAFFVANSTYQILLFLASLKLVGDAFDGEWFFQAQSKMSKIALRGIIWHSSSLIMLEIFVTGPFDISIAVAVYSFAYLFSSFYLTFEYLKENKLRLIFKWKESLRVIKLSLPIAVSFFSIMAIQRMDLLMIEALLEEPNYFMGIYSGAVKLMIVASLFSTLIQKVVFPKFSAENTTESKEKNFRLSLRVILTVGFIISTIFYAFSSELVSLQFSNEFSEVSDLLKYFSVKILLVYLASSIGVLLFSLNIDKSLMIIFVSAALINFILNYFFIPQYDMYGATIASIISELSIVIFYYYLIVKHLKKYFLGTIMRISIAGLISFFAVVFFKENFNLALSIILAFK